MSIESKLEALAAKWATAVPSERADSQTYIRDLTEALGVESPQRSRSGYEFEFPVRVVKRDGTESTNFIDLYKEGHFVLEAKAEKSEKSANALLQTAFGQAHNYAQNLAGSPPPYLMVLDVARTLIVWDRWSGTYGGQYAGYRIDLPTLHKRQKDIDLLRDIFENPSARDTRAHSQAVTKEIATQLADLSASLERRGHDQEKVARFLMRCVFTMFAEDVGLLNDRPFETSLRKIGLRDPKEFASTLGRLWRAMDGGRYFGMHRMLRFNGSFFKDAEALVLSTDDLAILLRAAETDWRHVEPSILGTLLTRALDPKERH